MFFLIDFCVYEWNTPNPNASLATLKKSSINPLIGFNFFQFSIFLYNSVVNLRNSCLFLFKVVLSLNMSNLKEDFWKYDWDYVIFVNSHNIIIY